MSDAFDKVMEGLRDLDAHLLEGQRKQAQELAALSRINNIPIYQSSNLPPYGVSVLIGPKLWEFVQEYLPTPPVEQGEG